MALKTPYALVDGIKMLAAYDSTTQMWTVEGNAPAKSSWGEPNHVFPVTLYAEDEAGNVTTMTADDEDYGDQLKLRVLEKTKPTATITSPTTGSVLGASSQDIVMELLDSGGSGLNMSSVVFKVNGTTITGLTWTDGSGGKKVCTYNATGLPDGSNTIELQVSDNDGNVSEKSTVTFIISTAAPTLNLTSPANNLLTNSNKVTVAGTAAAGSDAVTLAEVTINGTAVTVGSGGAFSKEITLSTEGENVITVTAKDNLGKTTTVTRTVTLDTKAPVISDVVAEKTTVDAGTRIKITFKVVAP